MIAFCQAEHYAVLLNPLRSKGTLDVIYNSDDRTQPFPAEALALAYHNDGYTVIRAEYQIDELDNGFPRILQFLPNCVTVVKYFMGLNTWHITPYQFYQWLIRTKRAKIVDEELIRGTAIQ